MNVLSLFSGIGGFELGLSWAGPFRPVAFCEQNAYARAVLAKNWPGVIQYDDVRTLTGRTLDRDGVGRIDVLTGGWPCQPHSVAGKRANSRDERDLWSEFVRIIGETRPRWVVGENVPGVLSSHDAAADRGAGGFFGRVLRDLAALGYDAEWHCYPASAVGAHHERSRVFLVAYPDSLREPQPEGPVTDERGRAVYGGETLGTLAYAEGQGSPRGINDGGTEAGFYEPSDSGTPTWAGGNWEQPSPTALTQPRLCGMAHGRTERVQRLERLGNGVVPQQAAVIGRAITEAEAHHAQYGVMPDQIVQPRHLVAR